MLFSAASSRFPCHSLDADADQVRLDAERKQAKYTPARGRIELSVRREGVEAVIAVSDTGVGIAGDALAGVFDMFSQIGRTVDRSQGGLGIGLSLVRRLVEMHGGSVVAESGGANAGSGAGGSAGVSPAGRLPRHRHAGHERLRHGARHARHGGTWGGSCWWP